MAVAVQMPASHAQAMLSPLTPGEKNSLHAIILEYLHSIQLHDSALALQREWLAKQQVEAAAALQPRTLSAADKQRAHNIVVCFGHCCPVCLDC
jgi:hypothetical protein